MTRALGHLLGTAASTATRAVSEAWAGRSPAMPPLPHVHRFGRVGDDPFSGATLYGCRCGVVRPAM